MSATDIPASAPQLAADSRSSGQIAVQIGARRRILVKWKGDSGNDPDRDVVEAGPTSTEG